MCGLGWSVQNGPFNQPSSVHTPIFSCADEVMPQGILVLNTDLNPRPRPSFPTTTLYGSRRGQCTRYRGHYYCTSPKPHNTIRHLLTALELLCTQPQLGGGWLLYYQLPWLDKKNPPVEMVNLRHEWQKKWEVSLEARLIWGQLSFGVGHSRSFLSRVSLLWAIGPGQAWCIIDML